MSEGAEQSKEIARICKKYNVAPHQAGDYKTREENEQAGEQLCTRCNGTGNEFFSMYRRCEACNGTGIFNEQYDYE